MSDRDLPPPRPMPDGAGVTASVTVLLLAGVLVALNVVVDRTVHDVSQLPRLLALLVGLVVAVPLVALAPPLARRLDWRVLGHPVVVAAAAFLAAASLSLGMALNVSAGLTDVFRTLGSFLVLCLCLLVLPLDPAWRRRLLQTAVVATLVAVVAAGWEMRSLVTGGMPSRRDMEQALLDGMMSNVNLFAGYLLLLLPWCVCAAADCRGPWRAAAGLATIAAVALLVVLQSRAAWLALAAATILCGITLLWHVRQLRPSRPLRLTVATGLAAATAAVVAGGWLAAGDTKAGLIIRRLFVSRPHQAAGPTDGGRTMVWGIAADMIADHPLLGVGAGNFTIRMHEYLSPAVGGEVRDFSRLSSDNWIHPHNDFLEVGAEHGLIGLAAYGGIFVLALLALRRVLHGDPTVDDARLATASLGAVTALVVFSCFDFPLDRISHQTVLAVHLAVIVLIDRESRPAAPPVRLPGWLIVPPVAVALALGLAYATAAVSQERAVEEALRAQGRGDWQAMRDAARRAATPWKTLDPQAVPVALLEGLAEQRLGDLPAATVCFERAFAANPNRLAVLQNLGAAYAQGGRLDDAVDIFAIAADRYSDRVEPRQNLAMALIDAERFTEAIAVIEDVPEPLRSEAMQQALAFARERVPAPPAAE